MSGLRARSKGSVKPFWLFCAGEDSGDILGESVVREIVAQGFEAIGSGGCRMISAGMQPLVPFDELPVNGFLDVVKKTPSLLRNFRSLQKKLLDKNCRGFVAIDYPGFNLRLMKSALAFGHRVIYVEPPQIFAWKEKRVKLFLEDSVQSNVELRVLYEVERRAYARHGLNVRKISHPFEALAKNPGPKTETNTALLLPGSREAQLVRNGKLYRQIANLLKSSGLEPLFVSSRNSLLKTMRKEAGNFNVMVSPASPAERFELFRTARCAAAVPGSAIVEAYLAQVPCVAAARIDPLTYSIGKRFVRTEFLTIPNIEAKLSGREPVVPEIVRSSLDSLETQARTVVEKLLAIS